MTHTRRSNLTHAALAGVTALGLAAAGQAAAQTQWTMTTTWPSSLELIELDRHWVELANQLAGDELQITFHEGGSLMPGTQVFDATSAGDIDAAGDWPGYWAGRSPAFGPLASTPMLFNGADYLNWIQEWGGFEVYQEVYGEYDMVYLPYGITNNESGIRTNEPIRSIEDFEGLRLRVSGRDQGRVLERLGAQQVSLAGGEIYQALERGVVDGAEFSVPGVDYEAGFHEVTDYWLTPGWHQSASVFGVMINRNSWDALSEETRNALITASEATLAWSLAWSERRSNEGTRQFQEAGVEITRLPDEDLVELQQIANEVIVESACEDERIARVYHSQVSYLEDYAAWRDVSKPFNLSRSYEELPDLEAIEECL
ncbi:TRAP transporter substrate-binding protein DctP [Sediminicurvatus halobius]|uniref:ABC transporter substrate-binding protein n=1 Tax=Sediminicurvatus halobius TaxID=2182432 RepID=A0A2U2MZZ8_9GAMM|nr:TRAP transporter substrate-binding protein DctP [Spiribacter halobius]PWG62575.1 ABC transporter substrate-binding protein [Spiribacter halobius]UEX78510.1 TRAP transporter substrate-binding protein DctP [Spiribacter halobius]